MKHMEGNANFVPIVITGVPMALMTLLEEHKFLEQIETAYDTVDIHYDQQGSVLTLTAYLDQAQLSKVQK